MTPSPASHTADHALQARLGPLLERLPEIEFFERRWGEIDSYGANWMLARRLGLPRPLETYATINWNHGVCDVAQISERASDLCGIDNYNFPNGGRDRRILVENGRSERLLRAAGYPFATAVGLPFIYEEQEHDIPRIPDSVIAFAVHSTPWFSSFDPKVNPIDGKSKDLDFPRQVARLREQFDLVAACVGASDVLLGNWIHAYEHNRIPWVTGAWITDRHALRRMQRIFRSFEFVATNSPGSHIFYALACGCKVFWLGEESDATWSQIARLDPKLSRAAPEENELQFRARDAKLRQLYPFLFCAPRDAVARPDVGGAVIGEPHRRAPEEIADLLGWRLRRSGKSWAPVNSADLKTHAGLLADYRTALAAGSLEQLRGSLESFVARGQVPRNAFLGLGQKLIAAKRLSDAQAAVERELEFHPANEDAKKLLAAFASKPPAPAGSSILFLAHGPGQVNGPNIWLTRLLPELKARGFAPRVLMIMGREGDCPIATRLRATGVPCDTARLNYTEDTVRLIIDHARHHGCRMVVPNLNVPGYFAARHLRAAGLATVGVLHSDDDFYRDIADEFALGRGGDYLSALVTVSDYQHETLTRLDCGTTRLLKAPYGAPIAEATARHETRPFRFLYTGRLVEEQKRISDTVRAMIALLRRQPQAEFWLCGDGPARPTVQALVQESGLGDRIKLFGNVAPEDLQRLLPRCQALVLLSDYEGIPIALMEAMGAGVVPLCTRIRSGIADIVRDGENGFIVDDRGASFLAAAENLIANRELWNKCSAAARAVVREKFSVAANADTWAQLLRELDAAVPADPQPACPADLRLPPVRSNPKGMAREDRRRPAVAVPAAAPSPVAGLPATRSVAGDLPVVLVRSHEFNYSETFVEDHVNHLSSRLTLLYGYPFPRFLRGGASVVPAPLEQKLRGVASGQVKLTAELWADYSAALATFLAASGAKAVLVETGLMGAFVHEACERARLPFVVHFHGLDAFGRDLLASWLGRYRKFFQTAAAVVAVSKAMHAQLLQLGAAPERTLLGPYGVAVDLPALADPAKAPPHFAAVGRFVEKKAPHLTLQAFSLVHRQVPEARLVLMGDGPLLATCQAWARQNGLADAVTFAGVCSREEVSRRLAASRVFVQHSVTAANGDSEGLPLAVLEAGAHGLPVVSTRHAGIPDAVREGVDGWLVAEKDVAGMAAAMLRLAQDAGEAARLGAAFRARVGEQYSRRRSLERLHGILQAAAERCAVSSLGEPLNAAAAPASPAAPAAAPTAPRPAPAAPGLTGPAADIAENRDDHAACLALGRAMLVQGKVSAAYVGIAEAHRLGGATPETTTLLQQLEDRGALGEPAVETYRRRAGWVPRRKSAPARRILVVTNLLPPQEMGGYGRTVWEFSRELEARGHAVRVLTADLPQLERKPTAEHRAFEANVRRDLRLFGDWQSGKVVAEPDLEVRREIARHNQRTIRETVQQFEPDAIMAGNLDLMGHHWVQEMLDRGLPVVHRLGNAHPGYDPEHAPRSPLFCVAGCSEWVNSNLRQQGYPLERYAVVPPGSPLTEYFRAFPPQWSQLRLAYAGLLMPYKGAHLIVEALAHLHRAGIPFECTLAGDSTSPDYLDQLRASAVAGGFSDRVSFPGFLGQKELAALFARSNVLVFPSVFPEPFGKTQIEAMAAGMLAVSSGSGGAAEIVRHAGNGLLFRAGDARDLAEKLAAVHRQPAAAARLAATGQADAFRFTTAASVDRLESLFTELLAVARRRSPQLARAAV